MFRAACRHCKFRIVKDKRSSCWLRDSDFMLKYYGMAQAPKGVRVSLGTIPQELRLHPLGREVEAWLATSDKRKGGRSNRYKKQIV